jgi:nitronate monooxygenase
LLVIAIIMWRTNLTSSFPCKLPIMGAPMSGPSGGLLAAETCRAGALGFVAAGYLSSLDELDKEIAIFRETAPEDAPLCLGFISHAALGSEEAWSRFETVLIEQKPQVLQFFAPGIMKHPVKATQNNIQLAQSHDAKVLVQVGSVSEAQEVLEAGVDGIIAQGSEAGGHGLRRELGNGTLPLAARIVSLVRQSQSPDIPVLAAGGIVDGRGLAAALALGCDGCVLGTRLWASQEALGHESFKQTLASSRMGPDQVIRTTVIDQIMNTYISTPWPQPYDSVGITMNSTVEEWDTSPEKALQEALTCEGSTTAADYKKAKAGGDAGVAGVLSGQGVGDIHTIEPAYHIIQRVNEEAMAVIRNLPQLIE